MAPNVGLQQKKNCLNIIWGPNEHQICILFWCPFGPVMTFKQIFLETHVGRHLKFFFFIDFKIGMIFINFLMKKISKIDFHLKLYWHKKIFLFESHVGRHLHIIKWVLPKEQILWVFYRKFLDVLCSASFGIILAFKNVFLEPHVGRHLIFFFNLSSKNTNNEISL